MEDIMKEVSTTHIEVTPGVAGGKPRIAGHRITVQDNEKQKNHEN